MSTNSTVLVDIAFTGSTWYVAPNRPSDICDETIIKILKYKNFYEKKMTKSIDDKNKHFNFSSFVSLLHSEELTVLHDDNAVIPVTHELHHEYGKLFH